MIECIIQHTLHDTVFSPLERGMFGKNLESTFRLTTEEDTSPPFMR